MHLLKAEDSNRAGLLAGEAGITKNMLSLIERGEGNPSWTTLEEIAKALGISMAELAERAEKAG